MKPYSSFVFSLGVVIVFITNSVILYGQTTNKRQYFLTYKDIRPAKGEIVDHSDSGIIVSKPNLFDYPQKTVTYILNGKSIVNIERVKKIIYKKNTHIKNVVISQPDRCGERTIYIKYKVL